MPKLPTLDLQPLVPPSGSGGLDLQPYEPPEQLDSSFGSGYGLPSFGDIATTAGNAVVGLGQAAIGGLDYLYAPQRKVLETIGIETPSVSGMLEDLTGYDPKMTKKFISSFDSDELKRAKQEQAQATGFSDTMESYWRNPGLAALDIEESAPQMLAGGALGRAVKIARPALSAVRAGALGEFGSTLASQAAQIGEEQGDFTVGDMLPATGSAALTALISGAGGKLAKGVGLPDVDAFLADRGITGSRRIPALLAAGLIEAGEEGAQSYQEQVGTNLATGKPWSEGASSAAASGMVSGFGMGSIMPAMRRGAPPTAPDDTFTGTGQTETEGFEGDEEAVGSSFVVPEAQVTDQFIKQMRENGFVRAGMLPGGKTLFKSVNEMDTPSPEVTPDVAFSPPAQTATPSQFDIPLTNPQVVPGPFNPNDYTENDRAKMAEALRQMTWPAPTQPETPVTNEWDPRNPYTRTMNIPVNQLDPDTEAELQNDGYLKVSQDANISTWVHNTHPNAAEEAAKFAGNQQDSGVSEMSRPEDPSDNVTPFPERPSVDERKVESFHKGLMGDVQTRAAEMQQRFAELQKQYPNVPPEWLNRIQVAERNIARHLQSPRVDSANVQQMIADNQRRIDILTERMEAYNNAYMGGPSGIVPPIDVQGRVGPTESGVENLRPRAIFNDEQARAIIDRAMPQPGPERQPDTEFGQNPIDQQIAEWERSQDGIIRGNQEQNGPLMGEMAAPTDEDEWGPITPGHAESLLPRQLPEAIPQNGEILPAQAEQTEFERLFGLQPGQQMSDQEIENVKQFYADQMRAMYGEDVVEGQAAHDEVSGTIGDERLHYPGIEDSGMKNITPTQSTAIARPIQQTRTGEIVAADPTQYGPKGEGFLRRTLKANPNLSPADIAQMHDFLISLDKPSETDRVTQLADDWGVDTEGKSIDQIKEDIYTEVRNRSTKQTAAKVANELGIIDPEGSNNFLTQMTGNTPDDFVRMEVGERTAILRNMQGSYAEHGARVANKELLQNAIDATPTGGNISVDLNYHEPNGKMSITVTDEGPGLNLDLIKNEFVTLTGSGKRGVASTTGRKTIGEMGVGKATYLLGTESFEVTTVAREDDGLWKYEFSGNPDVMIGEDSQGNPVPPMKINKTKMPEGTPTGTTMKVYETDKSSMEAAEDFLNNFAEYSDSPVNVKLTGNKYDPNAPGGSTMSKYNLNKTVTPRAMQVGKEVAKGSLPGGDYDINVPDTAKWSDKLNYIHVILTARGMFQGVESIWVGPGNKIPDRVVLNIEPTVSAQNAKLYPLTSPTREKLKGPYKQEIEKIIKKNVVEAAKDKTKKDIKAAYDALVPAKDLNGKTVPFVVNDRGGKYTPSELGAFVTHPNIQKMGDIIGLMLGELNALFPHQQVTKTVKYGFDLADPGKGGINIQDVDNVKENAILIGFFDALAESDDSAKVAGEMLAHTVLHEFNHNRSRVEGDDFTYKLRDTDSKFGTDRRAALAKQFEQLITDGQGKFAPWVLRLIQQHTVARGRPDTTIDFIARQAQGGFLERPESRGVSGSGRDSGEGSSEVSEMAGVPGWNKVQAKTGIGSGGSNTLAKNQMNWIKEALAVPAGMTTTMDLSAPFRQGLSQIHTPQFWKAIVPMLKAGFSEQIFNTIDADLRSKRVMQPRRNRVTGKVRPSIAQEAGLKMFESASHGNMSQRAQATASRWLEQGIGKTTTTAAGVSTWQSTKGSRAWANTIGRPIRASNRAYITFLNHLKVNRFEHLMRQGLAMSVQADQTGKARPGLFKQSYTQQEAAELDPYRNKVLAKEIADFVNTATGQGPLKTHILPTKHAEVSLEAAAGALQHTFFSPGLIASRVRMLNPNTYVMASPMVRRQYMMAALATGTAWMSALAMMKLGGGDEVEVNIDNMTSADWAKAKIGDTRMDPGGGFQQFLVSMARMIEGGTTSSSSGDWRQFGEGFMAQTQKSNLERFLSNKLNPVTKFAYDLASQSEYNPFHVYDRTAQLFVPLVIQDLIGLYYEDPSMLPWMGPIMLGMGTQTYGRGESVGKLVAPENDWLAAGGGFADLTAEEEGF